MRRKIICLTPVKNEAWILDYFLQSTSLWADHIIVADQGSADGSVEIAKKFDKVILVENTTQDYNESDRQKLLISEARKISGENNIFMALDADELLVNFHNNPDWEDLQRLDKGTTVWLPWLNVLPGNKTIYGSRSGGALFGYINDNEPHSGKTIHSGRLPSDLNENRVSYDSLKVLHFQYSVPARLYSKHRWYECFEKIKYPERNNIDIYRQYHHIDLPVEEIEEIDHKWLEKLQDNHINILDIKDDGKHWWDMHVCKLFDDYGVGYFKKQAIWYVNWNAIYQTYPDRKQNNYISDPRNFLDKWVHAWLAKSQPHPFKFMNKVINKLLRLFKW